MHRGKRPPTLGYLTLESAQDGPCPLVLSLRAPRQSCARAEESVGGPRETNVASFFVQLIPTSVALGVGGSPCGAAYG